MEGTFSGSAPEGDGAFAGPVAWIFRSPAPFRHAAHGAGSFPVDPGHPAR
jgi:hypothetical protein